MGIFFLIKIFMRLLLNSFEWSTNCSGPLWLPFAQALSPHTSPQKDTVWARVQPTVTSGEGCVGWAGSPQIQQMPPTLFTALPTSWGAEQRGGNTIQGSSPRPMDGRTDTHTHRILQVGASLSWPDEKNWYFLSLTVLRTRPCSWSFTHWAVRV